MKAIYYYWLLFLLCIFSGCSSKYIASPKNVPLFEEKGEVQIEVGTSTNSFFTTGSYAFSEKYALITNGSLSFHNLFSEIYDIGDMTGGRSDFYPSGDFAHRSFEAGIGKYNLFPSSSNRRFETFLGIGFGDADEGKFLRNSYLQGFIQSNVGQRTKHIEVGLSLRLAGSYFKYQTVEHNCIWSDILQKPLCEDVFFYKKFGVVHAEFMAFMNIGGKHLHGFIRYGKNLAIPLFLSSDERTIVWHSFPQYTIFHISTGLCYRFKTK